VGVEWVSGWREEGNEWMQRLEGMTGERMNGIDGLDKDEMERGQSGQAERERERMVGWGKEWDQRWREDKRNRRVTCWYLEMLIHFPSLSCSKRLKPTENPKKMQPNLKRADRLLGQGKNLHPSLSSWYLLASAGSKELLII
jgi:hypothetical protein